jgi:hypothetical protein
MVSMIAHNSEDTPPTPLLSWGIPEQSDLHLRPRKRKMLESNIVKLSLSKKVF